jgi:hypothetical protein
LAASNLTIAGYADDNEGVPCRSPSHGWDQRRHLQRGGGLNADPGRLQRTLRYAFIAGGGEITSTEAYDWCFARDRTRARSQAARWSVRRVWSVPRRGSAELTASDDPGYGGWMGPRRQIDIILESRHGRSCPYCRPCSGGAKWQPVRRGKYCVQLAPGREQ